MLNKVREELVNRVIRVYGFEHDITISFCQFCESLEEGEKNDLLLENMVKIYETETEDEEEF